MMHRLVSNILISIVMACALSMQPSTSAISLQKSMVLLFGGIMTPDLTPEGLACHQPQIYVTKLKFSELPVNIFSSLKFNPRSATEPHGGLLDYWKGDLST